MPLYPFICHRCILSATSVHGGNNVYSNIIRSPLSNTYCCSRLGTCMLCQGLSWRLWLDFLAVSILPLAMIWWVWCQWWWWYEELTLRGLTTCRCRVLSVIVRPPIDASHLMSVYCQATNWCLPSHVRILPARKVESWHLKLYVRFVIVNIVSMLNTELFIIVANKCVYVLAAEVTTVHVRLECGQVNIFWFWWHWMLCDYK